MLLIPLFAFAGQIYVWTDENGQTYVSENEPENWGTQKYEETKESKQAEIKSSREDAMDKAQFKVAEESKRRLPTRRKKG